MMRSVRYQSDACYLAANGRERTVGLCLGFGKNCHSRRGTTMSADFAYH
jgi:hypothetical protein